MIYNNNCNEQNEKYSWNPAKRELTIAIRGLDFVVLADLVFDDPDIVIRQDIRHDYGEDRYLAFATVANTRLCLCFTPREDKIHLITIFKMHEKEWRKYHDATK